MAHVGLLLEYSRNYDPTPISPGSIPKSHCSLSSSASPNTEPPIHHHRHPSPSWQPSPSQTLLTVSFTLGLPYVYHSSPRSFLFRVRHPLHGSSTTLRQSPPPPPRHQPRRESGPWRPPRRASNLDCLPRVLDDIPDLENFRVLFLPPTPRIDCVDIKSATTRVTRLQIRLVTAQSGATRPIPSVLDTVDEEEEEKKKKKGPVDPGRTGPFQTGRVRSGFCVKISCTRPGPTRFF
ncbi:hypothetical protein C1H46_010571 [Malus baccata]|uniref:Uncharacterized protein n=1 Tax=Malus baccata TaxID=106549 RepID=A0A540MYC3_MALBA|nr:hypothetical protein C1H46_010571 [Malus baccata]